MNLQITFKDTYGEIRVGGLLCRHWILMHDASGRYWNTADWLDPRDLSNFQNEVAAP